MRSGHLTAVNNYCRHDRNCCRRALSVGRIRSIAFLSSADHPPSSMFTDDAIHSAVFRVLPLPRTHPQATTPQPGGPARVTPWHCQRRAETCFIPSEGCCANSHWSVHKHYQHWAALLDFVGLTDAYTPSKHERYAPSYISLKAY